MPRHRSFAIEQPNKKNESNFLKPKCCDTHVTDKSLASLANNMSDVDPRHVQSREDVKLASGMRSKPTKQGERGRI